MKHKGKPEEHFPSPSSWSKHVCWKTQLWAVKTSDAHEGKLPRFSFRKARKRAIFYVHESVGELSVLTVRHVFYLLFWSGLRLSLPWILMPSRTIVTYP